MQGRNNLGESENSCISIFSALFKNAISAITHYLPTLNNQPALDGDPREPDVDRSQDGPVAALPTQHEDRQRPQPGG